MPRRSEALIENGRDQADQRQEHDLGRRDFFKFLTLGGTVGALSACTDVPEKVIPYLNPPTNVEFVPGKALHYATTCAECPAACGMIISTREGRAIKAEGNPDHPLSRGGLCIRGQASLQGLYNPARIPTPLLGKEGSARQEISQRRAESLLTQAIEKVRDPKGIVYLTDQAQGARGSLIDAWLQSLGASPKIVFDPLAEVAQTQAYTRLLGSRSTPRLEMASADVLINFGADFMETWGQPVKQMRDFAEMHSVYPPQKRKKGFCAHIGPHRSLSGANADLWLSTPPGSETQVALALAGVALQRYVAADFDHLPAGTVAALRRSLAPYTLERTVNTTGVALTTLKSIGERLLQARRPVAIAGGATVASQQSSKLHEAVATLNAILGSLGREVVFDQNADSSKHPAASDTQIIALIERMRRGEVELLIVDGANPLYHLPPSRGFGEALAKVGALVSLSSWHDETTAQADLAIPSQTFLERWGDAQPADGIRSLRQPVMATVYPLKAAEDTLLSVLRALQDDQTDSDPLLTHADFRGYLRATWQEYQKEIGESGTFESFWRRSLQRGGAFTATTPARSARPAVRIDTSSFARASLRKPSPPAAGGLHLVPFASNRHRAGEQANRPWLQEIPDALTQVVWDSWAEIHPQTARQLGLKHGEKLSLRNQYGRIETAVYLSYGVHPQCVAIPLGQGHTASGRDADHVGVRVVDLLPSQQDGRSGQFAYRSVDVQVKGGGEKAFLVQLDGAPRQFGRNIVQTISTTQLASGEKPKGVHHAKRQRDFYPPRREQTPGYYDPYRWGMVIDNDRCTGCSACVAACYAENNVAVVGKERAALGREMAWLRIERYLEGDEEESAVLMQPMLCQQCENAGCEPVCPVYATYHNPEGLNAQIYNRCVGTRYCSNNCAYKVRRFNWFEYTTPSPLHLQLNPDVTVRSKGVMEKCTFCVQRIHRARDRAQTEGRLIQDGEIQTACQQSCPSQAIVFGNLSDPAASVSQKARRQTKEEKRLRPYEVFPELANLPAVTYLRKTVHPESLLARKRSTEHHNGHG